MLPFALWMRKLRRNPEHCSTKHQIVADPVNSSSNATLPWTTAREKSKFSCPHWRIERKTSYPMVLSVVASIVSFFLIISVCAGHCTFQSRSAYFRSSRIRADIFDVTRIISSYTGQYVSMSYITQSVRGGTLRFS
uniref:Uncharacterized protein n=1 Tax=Compsopogon caeruleus TaxID=31354 RepID=A0A7S1TH90_9RHOD|mmetsp:Transcript_6822/g.14008  ORF Transcript_6822/g.14008 Transcript_6822/m.14008 type:complete len:136 (+) Transcript_6822:187-594(+)